MSASTNKTSATTFSGAHHSDSSCTAAELAKREKQRKLLRHFGYTIQLHCIGTNHEVWVVLLPGEKEFFDDGGDPPKQNYLGFFSREEDLLDEIAADLEFKRTEQIKAEYLASGCQACDVDEAVRKLMDECESLFENDRFAWSFLMEEAHEELETE